MATETDTNNNMIDTLTTVGTLVNIGTLINNQEHMIKYDIHIVHCRSSFNSGL